MDRFNPMTAALLIGFGLVLMAGLKISGGEPFYFWFAFSVAVFGTVSLTPWGRRHLW